MEFSWYQCILLIFGYDMMIFDFSFRGEVGLPGSSLLSGRSRHSQQELPNTGMRWSATCGEHSIKNYCPFVTFVWSNTASTHSITGNVVVLEHTSIDFLVILLICNEKQDYYWWWIPYDTRHVLSQYFDIHVLKIYRYCMMLNKFLFVHMGY